jgi:rare lipoprotein A
MSRNIQSNAERSKRSLKRFKGRKILLFILTISIAFIAKGASPQDSPKTSNPSNSNTSATLSTPVATITKSPKKSHWYQIGEASWYGPHFQGKTTANGETFDSALLTCAHRDLPLGSWIRVTNLHNHKTVIVRVNDRGPMVDDRIVDLSQQAMSAISAYGLAYVRLDLISPDEASKSMVTKVSSLEMPVLLPRTQIQ